MRLKVFATATALIVAAGLLATAADAAPKKRKVVYSNPNRTVVVTRGEDGRTRTRVIVEKRSYLDPGTETFPGEPGNFGYAITPTHRASGIQDNTSFGINQSALPGPFDLPSRNNPWLQY
ncbi:hypothetical protein DW352_19750 [Pseudolabrys taiwanensis]|uniref:Uncharacterized protein n=1 Tax=Pseudolabrys taiwanensis TaxID=331696 RepID=A0A346A061_9HYPH|nr:hypothetical protein [Pseudolabrys taiwanensis]AXK82558.1 hypothetical protein DW352_19750 [Pseudolabrys taiwanensis]